MFEFAVPTDIIFGQGVFAQVAPNAAVCGKHALLVTGKRKDPGQDLQTHLQRYGVATTHFHVGKEPEIEVVMNGVRMAQKNRCDFVIGMGGGSVLDSGKAIAAMMTNPGDIHQYLEVIGDAKPLKHTSAIYIAVPTTAGTGAETTKNAVLSAPEHRIKVSMRSPLLYPDMAIVDPELTLSLPKSVMVYTMLDAFTQVVESFLSQRATPFTDALCGEALRKAKTAMEQCIIYPEDLSFRESLSMMSLFSGIALSNAGLGAVHGFAGPLGGYCPDPAPHGALCGRLLPMVLQANWELAHQSESLQWRFKRLSELFFRHTKATPEVFLSWVSDFVGSLEIPTLSEYGIEDGDFQALIPMARASSSMKGNPVTLPDDVLETILRQAL